MYPACRLCLADVPEPRLDLGMARRVLRAARRLDLEAFSIRDVADALDVGAYDANCVRSALHVLSIKGGVLKVGERIRGSALYRLTDLGRSLAS